MKFYVVGDYLVSLSFKFHEGPCTNVRARMHTLAIKRACAHLQLLRAHLCNNLHEIFNLGSQDSDLSPLWGKKVWPCQNLYW